MSEDVYMAFQAREYGDFLGQRRGWVGVGVGERLVDRFKKCLS